VTDGLSVADSLMLGDCVSDVDNVAAPNAPKLGVCVTDTLTVCDSLKLGACVADVLIV
jgi:hypothetical protein